jgi:PKD repeat protein
MKRILLLLGFLFWLIPYGNSQQKIIYTFDKHERLKSSQFPDSLILKQSYDKVGNSIEEIIINPCFDRPTPVILYSSPLTFCQNDSVILTAPLSLKYKWSRGDTTRSIIVKTAGSYFVTTFNTLNCVKTSLPVIVKVNSLPQPLILAGGPTIFCPGSNVVLTSSLTGTYLWHNGKTTKSITADSAKNYKLTFTDSNGCKASATQTVSLYEKPKAGFNINNANQCKSGHSFTFTNTTSIGSGTMTYLWRNGDGTDSTSTNISGKIYSANYGTFPVKLIATSNNNCKDSISKTVNVYASPAAGFTINNDKQCKSGHSFDFTNTSSIVIGSNTHKWNHGDTTFASSLNSDAKTYSTFYGTHSVKLVVTSNNGCKDSIVKTVTVYASPVSGFSINKDKQCKTGHSFDFTNTSLIATGSNTFKWNHGDSTYTTATNSNSKTYSLAFGTYSVKLVATSNNGCKDSITQSVTVYASPTAGFSINNDKQCKTIHSFDFTNTSSIAAGSNSYSWNHGDGSTATTTNSTGKTYAASHGSFLVKLVSSSNNGCRDSIIKTVIVHPQSSVTFSINQSTQCSTGNSFNFTNGSSIPTGSYKSKWSFGDGLTDTSKNITTKNYSNPNTYSVKLILTSGFGCKDSLSKTIIVNPNPVAGFTILNNVQCFNGNKFNLTNTSTISSGTKNYSWDFGDTKTDTVTSPVKTYSSYGSYTIKLVATSNNGCKDSTIKSVTVYASPVAGFTINNDKQCKSIHSFNFSNTSTIAIGTLNYNWNHGDTTFATSFNSDGKKYTTSYGNHSVMLTATSNNGCRDSITKTVTVYASPVSGFSINKDKQCRTGHSFDFTNTTSIATGSNTYSWNHGDTTFATSTNSNAKTYSTTYGTHYVKLTATSNNGCKDSITKTVRVYASPTAGFGINKDKQCFSGHNFNYTNTTTIDEGSSTYLWNTGQGSQSTSTNVTNKTYSVFGNYTIKLVATSNNGCKDSSTKTITIHPQAKIAFSINDSSQCHRVNKFVFNNQTTIDNPDVISSYQWNFREGTGSTLKSPDYSYTNYGSYKVTLITKSDKGCIDSLSHSLVVHPQATINFSINDSTQCNSIDTFLFNNSSKVATGALNYYWTFGDASNGNSSSESPKYSYADHGTYKVKLKTTSDKNCRDSVTKEVIVYPQAIVKQSLNYTEHCNGSDTFRFFEKSTVASGQISKSRWKFDDSTSSNNSNPVHSYLSAKEHTIRHITETDNGCIDSADFKVTVHPQSIVTFTINQSTQCSTGNSFGFTNNSTIATGKFGSKWNFGDNETDSSKNRPVKKYSNPGTYSVKLVVTSDYGCKDSLSKTVIVNPNPVAGFTIPKNPQCYKNNSFNLANTTSISSGTKTYFWSFGDTDKDTAINPVKKYYKYGTYSIKLVAKSNNGCKDSSIKSVTVFASPTLGFTNTNDKQCYNEHSFNFTNTSSIDTGTNKYRWDYGDGDTSTKLHTSGKTYTAKKYGTYYVKLVATSNNLCKDSISKYVTVNASPKAKFSINTEKQCFKGHSFDFTNESSIDTGNISFKWNLGDGDTSTKTNINKKNYKAPSGTYFIKLVSISNNLCKDSAIKSITVFANSAIGFKINKDKQCFNGHSFDFTDTSKGATIANYLWTFGDTKSATTQNITGKQYNTDSIFTVIFITTTDNACKDTAQKTVTIYGSPKAQFDIDKLTQCFNYNSNNFTNNSTLRKGAITNYHWSFGDGTDTASKDVIGKKYKILVDSFKVDLLAISDNKCRDSITKYVKVFSNSKIGFKINDSTQCFNVQDFAFINTTTNKKDSVIGYRWYFGDNTDSLKKNILSKKYKLDSSYNVTLISRTDKNCYDTLKRKVFIYPNPKDTFLTTPEVQCFKANSTVFTSKSKIRTGSISSVYWDFGDGKDTMISTPVTKKYKQADTFIIILRTISNYGCRDSIKQKVIIHPQAKLDFSTKDTQCFKGNNFTFTNHSSIDYGSLSYLWDHGDGSTSNKDTSYNKYYGLFGNYQVTLTSKSDHNCLDTLTKKIKVNASPVAMFSIDTTRLCSRNNRFNYLNNSSINDGSKMRFDWKLGDKVSKTDSNITNYNYTTEDSFNIELITFSNEGCSDTATGNVITYPQPTAKFSIKDDSQCVSGNHFNFIDASFINKKDTIYYFWQFGDGNISNLRSPDNTYKNSGNYIIKLTTTSKFGCTDSKTDTAIVHSKPTVYFLLKDTTDSAQCLFGNKYNFQNKTTLIPFGNLDFKWTFDDDSLSGKFEPIHSYVKDGVYNIKLVATSIYNCKDSFTKSVTVYPKPIVNFKINKSFQCLLNNRFLFKDTSTINTGKNIKWTWYYGEGIPENDSVQDYSYLNHGTFQVKLVVKSDKGCKDSLIKSVTVYPQPKAIIDVNDSTQCFGGHVFIFADSSKVFSGPIRNEWKYSDGDSSNIKNPQHSFGTKGKYRVWMKAITNFGCTDTSSRELTIFKNPDKPVITHQGNLLISSNKKGNAWFLNGNRIDTARDQSIIATVSGKYVVITTNSDNCDSISDEFQYDYNGKGELGLNIYPNPNAGTFSIGAKVKINYYKVFDATGQKIYESNHNLNSELETFSQALASGTYFVQVFTEIGFQTERLTVIP